ncbi:MAG: 3D domain-containing protein [Kiritimatiellia bacterium]
MKQTIKTAAPAVSVLALLLMQGCRTSIRPPEGVNPVERNLTVTAYCPCGKCCGWHRNWLGRPVHSSGPQKGQIKKVGITAAGTRARPGTIAADTRKYPFGTIMYIDGYGYGKVEDRGGGIKGNHIDLFFRYHNQAVEWGRQTKRVKIWFPRGKD